jgi:phosphatidylserine/phosphatidylglycerophosphate/cardiolipin synthase-like enzyme
VKFAAPGFTGLRRAPLRGFAPFGRRPPTFALRALLAAFFIGFVPGAARGPLDTDRMIAGLRIFYAPRTDLREIDLAVLASARETIDIAAFILSDRAIMEALASAGRRGVKVRLYLDPDQPALKGGAGRAALANLLNAPGVQAKVKTGEHLMHLKAYQADRRVLRTGSSNFSISGGSRQNNDLILIESQDAIAGFLREFDYLWSRPDSEIVRAEALPSTGPR